MNLKTVIIFIFAAFTITETTAQKAENPEGEILEKLIPNFNKLVRVRPVSSENTSAPVTVWVSLYVRSIPIVGEHEYSTQLTFRQKWRDERLSYSSQDSTKYVSLTDSKNEIWQPDTLFTNDIDAKYHDMLMRNEYIRIWPNGTVLKSVRISLRFSCPMYFGRFPFDSQICSIRLTSYGFTNRDLLYKWVHENPAIVTTIGVVTPNFELKEFATDTCDIRTNNGVYSCLRLDFIFKRFSTSYLVGVYIPSMMMVFTSWVSFWISPKAVTSRTILATMTLFVLAIQVAEANKTFPQTPFTKAVDAWTGTCLTFVFATLLEFATVHYLSNRQEKNGSSAACSKTDENAKIETNDGGRDEEQEIPIKDMSPRDGNKVDQGHKEQITQRVRRVGGNLISKLESSAHKLDVISRVAFPTLFVLFNIYYWLVYYF